MLHLTSVGLLGISVFDLLSSAQTYIYIVRSRVPTRRLAVEFD
jgi:hypothetical protein